VTGRRLAVVLAALAVSACATGGKLRQNSEVVRADVEKAKRSGAVRCAPKELALAEANVDFAEREVAYGHAARAKEHLEVAERSVKRALELSRSCAPTQVTIARRPAEPPPEPEPKRIVRIEKTDRDGDGVPDLDDACPDLPGKPEFKGCPDTDGDGIVDSEDACPNEAGPRETQGCPIAKDSDGDGIPDDIDRCPLDPEDFDGFQDEDGCPDADNDGDGIVDRLDACPNDAGPIENRGCPIVDRDGDGVLDPEDRCPDVKGPKALAGCPDTDGDGIADLDDKCPDQFGPPPDGCPKKYTLVEVKRERIEIRQQVHFDTAKYRILSASFPLLDQVVQVLSDFPKMRISVEGHTDSVGTDVSNLRLSQQRADAVRDYLMAKGVGPARLDATGFGPTRPVASNKTAKGRAQNRRTEFRIVSLE
jgi:OmpA-OmpF porin, OOP family